MNVSTIVIKMMGATSMNSEKRSASRTRQLVMLTDAKVSTDAQEIVRSAAEPVRPGERICAQIWRAATRLDLSYAKTKAYWYAERRRVSHSEFENLKARLDALQERAEYRKAILDDMDKALLRARTVVGEDGENAGSLLGVASSALAKTL